MEKLSHHRSGITVEFDGVLERSFVGIEFGAVAEFAVPHVVHSMDSHNASLS